MQIGIIGYGEFGVFIKDAVNSLFPHIQVKVYSRSHKADNKIFFEKSEVCNCNYIIPCVPISAFENTIKEIAELVSPHSTIIDVCSIKVYPVKILKRYAKHIKYIATHPMFGPNSFENKNYDMTNKRLVITESNTEESELRKFIDFAKSLRLEVIECTSHEHDELEAKTQFMTMYIGQILKELKASKSKIDTVSYRKLLEVLEIVKSNDILFKEIYMYNPYAKIQSSSIIKSAETVLKKLTKI